MEFTHFDSEGNAQMVDVGGKEETKREATARGKIYMSRQCLDMVTQKTVAKGDVLGVARVAGIMGAKRTADLIPLCHVLNLTKLTVDFQILEENAPSRPSAPPGPPAAPGWRWRRSQGFPPPF